MLNFVVLFRKYFQSQYFRQPCARFCTGVLIIGPVYLSVCFCSPAHGVRPLFCQSFYPTFTQLLLLLYLHVGTACIVCCISVYSPMMNTCLWVCVAVAIKRFSWRVFLEFSASVLLPTHGKSKRIKGTREHYNWLKVEIESRACILEAWYGNFTCAFSQFAKLPQIADGFRECYCGCKDIYKVDESVSFDTSLNCIDFLYDSG